MQMETRPQADIEYEPLSYAQQRLWFIDQLSQDGSHYNIPFAMRPRGRLVQTGLQSALDRIVLRHQVLRTSFSAVDGKVRPNVGQARPVPLSIVERGSCEAGQRERRMNEVMDREVRGKPVAQQRGAGTTSVVGGPGPGGGLYQLCERQAARMPEAIAAEFEGSTLTYAELTKRADQLAHFLVACNGVQADRLLWICAAPGWPLIVALLGVLKADAAYVPNALSRLVYVMYTSSSTGTPKGVMVEHCQVGRLISITQPLFGFGDRDVWVLFHSFVFDVLAWESWGALAHGGRLQIVPKELIHDSVRFYRSRGARPGFINMYDATEAAVLCTFKEILPDDAQVGSASVGRCFDDMSAAVLSPARLARGYLRQRALTGRSP